MAEMQTLRDKAEQLSLSETRARRHMLSHDDALQRQAGHNLRGGGRSYQTPQCTRGPGGGGRRASRLPARSWPWGRNSYM